MDDRRQAIAQVEAWVREMLEAGGRAAHGWPHTARVRENILILAHAEGVDPLMAELAALLHDVGRTLPAPTASTGPDRQPWPCRF